MAGAAQEAAQEPRFPSRLVNIDVSVSAEGARVREEYIVDGSLETATFEILDAACSSAGPISAAVGDRSLQLDAARRGPWTVLRANEITASDDRRLLVAYDVRLHSGAAAVPIVLPAATLDTAKQAQGAEVRLRVAFAREMTNAAVLLPRLIPDENGVVWQERLLAIPSIVRVRVPIPEGCGRSLAGSTGGLQWRFWVFVGTMAVWIPIYFWSLGRGSESD